jgi:toxin CcdB
MSNQFDVHHKPGTKNSAVPFVLVVQSNRFRQSDRRVVIPLVAADAFRRTDSDIGPHFIVAGRDVVLDPLQVTNVSARALGPVVASLADDDDRIINAIDALLSRA